MVRKHMVRENMVRENMVRENMVRENMVRENIHGGGRHSGSSDDEVQFSRSEGDFDGQKAVGIAIIFNGRFLQRLDRERLGQDADLSDPFSAIDPGNELKPAQK